jgi:hypothetical protein
MLPAHHPQILTGTYVSHSVFVWFVNTATIFYRSTFHEPVIVKEVEEGIWSRETRECGKSYYEFHFARFY